MGRQVSQTPYWPWSPSIGWDDSVHPDPSRFVGEDVVATEKLDGGNILLQGGKVYARSVAAPSEGKWMAMVKKHHAWKVQEPGVGLWCHAEARVRIGPGQPPAEFDARPGLSSLAQS